MGAKPVAPAVHAPALGPSRQGRLRLLWPLVQPMVVELLQVRLWLMPGQANVKVTAQAVVAVLWQ